MPDTRHVVIPDTDGELTLWLDRLEELLISVGPLPGGDDAYDAAVAPLRDGAALAALGRLSVAVHAAERAEWPALIAPDGRFELVALRLVAVDAADVATVADALAGLGRAGVGGGDEFVAEALTDHAARHRIDVAEFVAGCTRAHALLDPSPHEGTVLRADLLRRPDCRIVLTDAEHREYKRLANEHLNVFHLDDPLARFLYRGSPWSR